MTMTMVEILSIWLLNGCLSCTGQQYNIVSLMLVVVQFSNLARLTLCFLTVIYKMFCRHLVWYCFFSSLVRKLAVLLTMFWRQYSSHVLFGNDLWVCFICFDWRLLVWLMFPFLCFLISIFFVHIRPVLCYLGVNSRLVFTSRLIFCFPVFNLQLLFCIRQLKLRLVFCVDKLNPWLVFCIVGLNPWFVFSIGGLNPLLVISSINGLIPLLVIISI